MRKNISVTKTQECRWPSNPHSFKAFPAMETPMDRDGPMRRVCPNCAQLMPLVRRTRDLRSAYAIFNFECESCRVGYTEADDSERNAYAASPAQ
jgi:hypothetical protein